MPNRAWSPAAPRRGQAFRALGAAAGIVAVVGLSACGSSSTTSSGPTTTVASSSGSASKGRLAAFESCMESKGIPASALPTGRRPAGTGGTVPAAGAGTGGFGGGGGRIGRVPTSLPAGVTQAQYSAALTACRSTIPRFGGGRLSSPAFTAYRQCLQLHGFTPPGGPAGSTSTTAAGATTTTVAAATRQAAVAACAALRPAASGSSTPTSTTVGG